MWRWVALVLLVALTAADTASAAVAKPRFVRNIDTGETGWFSSPGLVDLTGDKKLEIVAPFYSTFVYSAKGRLLGKGTASEGRVYAPGVVADLDRDGVKEIVVGGNDGTVAAYNLGAGGLQPKAGWPASTCSGGQCPETRGMAAADLDGDGRIEVVATTTNTSSTGSQVFVFTASGANAPGWPRYSAADATFNGVGNHGYGAYGENVGIGQLDDDPQREVVVTYDNHQINLFNHDGTSVLASPWYTNRQSGHVGKPLRLGPVHPLAQAQGRGRPLPPARRRLARREQDAVAAVDGLAAVDRRPRPRRQERGHRRPQRRAEGAVRDAGLRVHGARRRVRQGVALGSPAQGLQPAPAHEQAGGAPRRRLVPAERHPRAEPSSTSPATAAPRSSPRSPTASSTRSARRASACGGTTTPAEPRRPSRPRSSPPT